MQTGSESQGEPSLQPSVDEPAEGQKTPKGGTAQQDPVKKYFVIGRVKGDYTTITKEDALGPDGNVGFLGVSTDSTHLGPDLRCKHLLEERKHRLHPGFDGVCGTTCCYFFDKTGPAHTPDGGWTLKLVPADEYDRFDNGVIKTVELHSIHDMSF
jgi:hypothetical protein